MPDNRKLEKTSLPVYRRRGIGRSLGRAGLWRRLWR
jgi:hypothetical protein